MQPCPEVNCSIARLAGVKLGPDAGNEIPDEVITEPKDKEPGGMEISPDITTTPGLLFELTEGGAKIPVMYIFPAAVVNVGMKETASS